MVSARWIAAARRLTAAVVAAAAAVSAGCGAAYTPKPDAAGVVWLCRPGQRPDPCAGRLDATWVAADGSASVHHVAAAADPPVDCFYVYPTVSRELGANADLRVQPAEVDVALAQAAQFSQVCRVFAPVYRQRTLASIARGLGADPRADLVAYRSVAAAWSDFLAHDSRGRPFVLIGHSQGAAVLIRLMRQWIDDDAALRARLIGAIVVGGNVTVAPGRRTGGSFAHIPLCDRLSETGCVIAYSSFSVPPPADSQVGRPGQGVSLQWGQTARSGVQVACVNPASPSGGSGLLNTYYPSSLPAGTPPPSVAVSTPWVAYPGRYTAVCRSSGGATWLQVRPEPAGRSDVRPLVTASAGSEWGLHADDINLALGNLVADVRAQVAAYQRQRAP